MTSTSTRRIGPAMMNAVRYVAAHEGCTQQEAALAAGPNGSNKFGTAIVRRAALAGLIEYRDGKRHGSYALYVTGAGAALLP